MAGWGLPGPTTLLSSLPSKPDPIKDGKNGTQVRGASSETNQKILPLKNPQRKFRLEECQIYTGIRRKKEINNPNKKGLDLRDPLSSLIRGRKAREHSSNAKGYIEK